MPQPKEPASGSQAAVASPVASDSADGHAASALAPALPLPRVLRRPNLRQVLSEPSLRREVLGLDEAEEEPRRGLGDFFALFDGQTAAKRQELERRWQTQAVEEELWLRKERNRQFIREAAKRPAWNYPEPMQYFQNPLPVERGPGTGGVKNTCTQGMYDAPGILPPHSDQCEKCLGWINTYTNDRGEVLAPFGTKARDRMSPPELKYSARLDAALASAKALEKDDALVRTSGVQKRKSIESNCEPFSALAKGGQKAWTVERVSHHAYFSLPQPDGPGDGPIDPGLQPYIEQPERTMSNERNFIAGDAERVSYWKPPKAGKVCGSADNLAKAQWLLCPRGCRSLLRKSKSTSKLLR